MPAAKPTSLLARALLLAALAAWAGQAPAADAADVEARKAQARHDQQVKAAELEVANKKREIDMLQKSIEDCDKRALATDKKLEKARADLEEVQGAKQKLADAKAAMDAAEERSAKEFQKNHNPNTNSGGASEEATKAQEAAQKEWQRLKRLAASSDSELPAARQRVSSLERERKNGDKKKDDYLKKLEDAKAALAAAQQKLADLQAAPAAEPKAAEPAPPAGETPAEPAPATDAGEAAKDPAPAKDAAREATEAKPEAKPDEPKPDAPAPTP
jgi:chromosome segregation ATPase